MRNLGTWTCVLLLALGSRGALGSDAKSPITPVDPTVNITKPVLQSEVHAPLPEQYIWTADQENPEKPRFLRATFTIPGVPAEATLYLAGPGTAQVYVNGQRVGDFAADPTGTVASPVYHAPVARQLQPGRNVIAIRAAAAAKAAPWLPDSPTTKGALAVKIVPAGQGVSRPALIVSGPDWKGSSDEQTGWATAGFDDASWPAVRALGSIEGNIDFFLWNGDAGLYRWPGYDGISPFLMHVPLSAGAVREVHEGVGRFAGLENLSTERRGPITVTLPDGLLDKESAPSLVLDMGREVNGRLEVVSDSAKLVRLTLQYGESFEEAMKKPYLGPNEMLVPPSEKAYGPKSAFRYVRVQFYGEGTELKLRSLGVDGIYYPVKYQGSFESSDALLNRIWEVGAHTAHLCMQDDIWDAPKRDRGRWMGDLDVMGNTINHVFADHFLMEDTMNRLNPVPVKEHVNTIPGYSAFWVMGEADYYRQFGSKSYLQSVLPNLKGLLTYMEGDLDEQNLFANLHKVWPFVDWSDGLNSDTPEARRATQFEYYRAFRDAAFLLREVGDTAAAEHYETRAAQVKDAAYKHLLDPATKMFGPRWQTNAMAIYSGIADPEQAAAIRKTVFAAIERGELPDYDISTYYFNYFLYGMSQVGDRQRALQWIRKNWGGMLDQGATSFWEGYDLRWPKEDFHATLKADNSQGYFVSLSHGWASGPTPWLMDNVLGVTPLEPGFRRAQIRPDLLDLSFARGAVPTPSGLIRVDLKKGTDGFEATLDVPAGVEALVSMPVASASAQVLVNAKPKTGEAVEDGTRKQVVLTAGHYVLRTK